MNIPSVHPVSFALAQVAQPGVVISNAWPQSRATAGETARAIETVLRDFPFFEAYQTVDIPTAAERRAVRELLGARGRPHTYTLTRVLGEQKLNLSSLDPVNRQRAIATIIAQFDCAQEAGANAIGLISGPRPADPAQRTEALRALEDSLAQLAAALAPHRGLQLIIEPLDYEAHKRNTLGSTPEAVALCRRLAERNLPVALCLDTSHLLLNGEDTIAAVAEARDFIAEFHFCNPVLDRASPLFGDQHLPFGAPGALDIAEIAALLSDLHRIGYLSPATRPRVYCEVLPAAAMSGVDVVAHCQDALLSAWERVRTSPPRSSVTP
jgi:sugar phosphate isomerase/epimerase